MSMSFRMTCRGVALATLLWPGMSGAARFRVCTVSLHQPEEMAVFTSQLPGSDFEFVDITPPAPLDQSGDPASWDAAGDVTEKAARWPLDACSPDLTCDMVVITGEFAGRFFGQTGASIGLQQLEEAACRRECNGLFHKPKEVFLLACNTLATKDRDSRTPQQYLNVLLDHGFDQPTAERVVELRYGPLGPSFHEALRRVFMGVPRVYGFSSVAPKGESTAPMLARYFRTRGDYAAFLDANDGSEGQNRALLSAFGGTSMVQSRGLQPDDPGSVDRTTVCRLYDEDYSVVDRLRRVADVMARPDFLSFMPTLEVFFERHPPEQYAGETRVVFEQIQRLEAARTEILRLVNTLRVSALKLALAHLAVHFEWMAKAELHALAIESARQLLQQDLSSEAVDIMCEVTRHEPIGEAFTSNDLTVALFENPEGVRLIQCLAPVDSRVDARLLAAMDSSNAALRAWAAYALSRRPLGDDVLIGLTRHLWDPAPDVRERVAFVYRALRPRPSPAVLKAIRAQAGWLADELTPPEPQARSWWSGR